MDNNLLEKIDQSRRVPEIPENVEEVMAEEQPAYRDLEIEPRKPPVRVRFNPPFSYDGQEYKELIFDFDALTGRDFIRLERKFQALYKPQKNEGVVMPEMKHLFHDLILGELAGVPHTMIDKLERRYYVPLRTEALKACGSSTEEETKA
jgi:hypothetical protein